MLDAMLVLLLAAPQRSFATAAVAAGFTPDATAGVQGGAAQHPLVQDDTETRISFDVKEADIADVVRVLAEVGSFQVVMDPGVSCKLTLKLTEVRWPVVLEMALKSCGLGRDEEDGVVRIAPVARLADEAAVRRKLEEARDQAAPRTITTYRLSYARAEQLAPILKKLLPPRAEVIFDARTNTLIVIQ